MPLTVPPAKNYSGQLIAVPAFWDREPIEGARMIPCEILWASMASAGLAVSFNFQTNAPQGMSQMVALSVDNSACGADVEFIFPDTGYSFTVPALDPYTVVPIFTNGQQMYVVAPDADPEDVTRFQIHNKMPPPVAVPRSTLAEIGTPFAVALANTAGFQLIPAGVSGTIETLHVPVSSMTLVSTAVTGTQITFFDGNGSIATALIGGGFFANNNNLNLNLFQLDNLSIRFVNGFKMGITGCTSGAGLIFPNVTYRTP